MTENITVFKQNSIRIETDKGNVYIDPFEMEEELHDAAVILITHDHYDHFDINSIEKIKNDNTIVVVPASLKDTININYHQFMKKYCSYVFAALLIICGAAVAYADDLTVFDGSQVSPYVPLPTANYNSMGTRGQVIYPAEALTAMVGQPINGFTLYVNDEGCKMNGGELRISMAEVEAQHFIPS